MTSAIFGEARAARAQAQAETKKAFEARLADPAVVRASELSLAAIKGFFGKKFAPEYFNKPGAQQVIATRFGFDPATEKAWDPAVAELVARSVNAQTGDDAGFAECHTFVRAALMGDRGCNRAYIIVAESAEAAANVPKPKDERDLSDPWPFEDSRRPL